MHFALFPMVFAMSVTQLFTASSKSCEAGNVVFPMVSMIFVKKEDPVEQKCVCYQWFKGGLQKKVALGHISKRFVAF